MTKDEKGSCNCGAVKVIVLGGFAPDMRGGLCHCRACQKSGGCLSSYIVAVPSDKVQIETDNPDTLGSYKEEETYSKKRILRYFCRMCGSPMYARRLVSEHDTPLLALKVALFDVDMEPVMEIFRKNCAKWEQPFVGQDKCYDTYPGDPDVKST